MGGFTILLALHSTFVLPSILHKAYQQTREEIERHEERPHTGAVSRREFEMVIEQFHKRFDTLESKVDRIKN